MADTIYLRNTSDTADAAIDRYKETHHDIRTTNAAVGRMLEEFWRIHDENKRLKVELERTKRMMMEYVNSLSAKTHAERRNKNAVEMMELYFTNREKFLQYEGIEDEEE